MNQIEKLRILLPHWIEHNLGHGEECRKWSEIARVEGNTNIADHIDGAIKAMLTVNELLEKALHEAGGRIDGEDGGHHHLHHHHEH
jgi:hypothetical protein